MRAGAVALVWVVLLAVAPAVAAQEPDGSGRAPVDLDVLFVGAHPDDEAFGLAVYGAWAEELGTRTGVVTITRGEGGGNAVGPEEGPALGLLREGEERRAVARAGIRNVYNLDEVDFYYTVSAPLTRAVWQDRDTLARLVRIVRRTRPEVVVTMDPAPTPGNHGHHQMAARLAVEAYGAAADPDAFPGQLTGEGLAPWRVKRIFVNDAAGEYGDPTGPECVARFTPAQATDETFALWAGARAGSGETWAQVAREAQREYASQGWATFPDVPSDPAQLGCDRFTQIAARVPYGARSVGRDAMLEGALVPAPGGLPLQTELRVAPRSFEVAPGGELVLDVRARGPRDLGRARVRLELPRGWRGRRTADLGPLESGRDARATVRVRVPAGARPGRVRLPATLQAAGGSGTSSALAEVVPAVRGALAPLPQVADFRSWTAAAGVPQLGGRVDPVIALATGATRAVRIELRNAGTRPRAGTVTLRLPAGFRADAASKPFAALPAGGRGAVSFQVTNTDPALETSEQGGDRPFAIVTRAGGATATARAALELVPRTSVPQAAAAPVVDGVAAPGEYGGAPLDLSRRWEGDDPRSPADASGTARATWSGDLLYVAVDVTDDVLGTVLPRADAKRHWRTDSVELAIDPRGDAENTSGTFKVGVFPTTREGGPAAYRDADNRQGPVAETAPGLEVAARLRTPYTGYTLELALPLAELPAAVRSGAAGLNVFIYDSDTRDKTGQTRLGWSTWGGVQGDPYRWGRLALEGDVPQAGLPATPRPAVFPREAAMSVDSPQSIVQAAADGVPLAGGPQARDRVHVDGEPQLVRGDRLRVRLRAEGRGVAHVFAVDASGRALGSTVVALRRPGGVGVAVPVSAPGAVRTLAVAFAAAAGGTDSVSVPVG